MLRTLLWLRWTLGWRATDRANRIATALVMALMFVAFSPLIVGGAWLAHRGVLAYGAPVVVVAFGLCQVIWLWMGLLSGAMGRLFDLEQLIRYPVRPRTVYLVNLFATLTEPLALMTLPTMTAVVIAVGQREGAGGALLAGAGALLLMITTSALMQLLLALLDDLLRREWMRFVAAAFTSVTFIAVQWVMRDGGDRVVLPLARQEISPEHAVRLGAELFGRIPTIMAPAALASLPFTGELGHALWLVLALLGGIALTVAAGSRLIEGAALRRGGGGGAKAARAPRARGGSFAGAWSGLPNGTGALLAREMLYTVRTPQLIYQVLIPPLLVLLFYSMRHETLKDQPGFAFAMLSTLFMGRNLMLFGYDGPGVRTLFLLPVPARSIVLAKDLGYLVTVALQAAAILAVIAALGMRFEPGIAITAGFGALAVMMVALMVGNHYSIANPRKPASRGFARRGGGSLASMLGILIVLAASAAVAGLVWLARRLSPASFAPGVGMTVAVLLALGAIALWWLSIGRAGQLFLDRREKLIEVLAKADAT